ncbi:S9 family peptidase, partial [Fulvivirga sp. RKSG066]|nr:S9 family peptidase [Fulvivirga aurantia]
MNRLSLFAVLAIVVVSCQSKEDEKEKAMNYPETQKVDTVDKYFETEVPDPYRWLEDDTSEETAGWVKAQNDVTFAYL